MRYTLLEVINEDPNQSAWAYVTVKATFDGKATFNIVMTRAQLKLEQLGQSLIQSGKLTEEEWAKIESAIDDIKLVEAVNAE